MVGRPYEEERDLAAVTRMWREVGWIDDSDDQAEALRRFLDRGTALLADVHGEAECMVHRTPGSLRYVATDLTLCAISGVTTSHVGRRQGLASALLVEALGFREPGGRLTHALFGSMKDEHGPWEISVLSHEEPTQVLELLGLVRALGDQVNAVTIADESPRVQLQDLIREPVRQRRVARLAGGSDAPHQSIAEHQDRILDLAACIGAVHLRTPPMVWSY